MIVLLWALVMLVEGNLDVGPYEASVIVVKSEHEIDLVSPEEEKRCPVYCLTIINTYF